MGYLRLFRRKRIGPGLSLNLSKAGPSLSFGPRGTKLTIGRRGIRKTVGLPGSGLYYTSLARSQASVRPSAGANAGTSAGLGTWLGLGLSVLVGAAVVNALGGGSGSPAASHAPANVGAQPTEQTSDGPVSAGATTIPRPRSTPTAIAVRRVTITASVARGGTARLTVRTTAGVRCSIEVDYASGPSSATGLSNKTATSSGSVSWSWRVGSGTTQGTWPIHVTCAKDAARGSLTTDFTVR